MKKQHFYIPVSVGFSNTASSNRVLCSDFFGHVGKRFDKKAEVNFKIYDVINLERNNCNTQIVQYLKK